jgi:hypothetical protein
MATLQAQNLRVQGGNITLTIVTAVPGGQPVAVTNTAASLRYRTQTVLTKITVQSACPVQRFTLKVVATAATGGTAQPEVTLVDGMAPTDLISSIPTGNPKNRSATLQYSASATFDQGNSTELGSDIHTVTFTLIAQ